MVQGEPEAGDRFGSALAVGDFDNDGFDDLAIGVPGEGVSEGGDHGAVNVLYGSIAGLVVLFNQIWSQDSPGVIGVPETHDSFGRALAVGDFNGDGFDDIAIGAPGENIEFVEHSCGPGAVNVLYGSANRLSADDNQIWAQDSTNVEGVAENYECFGRALAAGDFDGDGFSDLAIGVPVPTVLTSTSVLIVGTSGAVNILYGTGGGLSAAGDQIWSQANVLGDAQDDEQFGWALAAGDLNGDGYDDLAVGVPRDRIAGEVAGAVNVLYGSPGGLAEAGNQRWHQNSRFVLGAVAQTDIANTALGMGDNGSLSIMSVGAFGAALSIGDFDGDGFDDLAIGHPGKDVNQIVDAGAVTVLYGSPSGLTAAGNQLWHQASPGVTPVGEALDGFGQALIAGDFNGDGHHDLAIGVPNEDIESIPAGNAGAVYVLYGS